MIPALLAMLAAAPADTAPIMVVGRVWAPFISPMGEPFRASSTGEDTMGMWFAKADADADGRLTRDEVAADAARFFTRLDENGDGKIEPDEVVRYEWQIAPDIQLGSPQRRNPGDAPPPPPKESMSSDARLKLRLKEGPLQGAARYALLNIPQPVTAADSDFNRTITRVEFLAAAQYRFGLLDPQRSGALTMASLGDIRAKVFADAKKRAKKRVKPGEEDDERVGSPL